MNLADSLLPQNLELLAQITSVFQYILKFKINT